MTIETKAQLIDKLGEDFLVERLGAKKNTVQQWKSQNHLPKWAIIEISFLRKFQALKLGGIKGIKELRSGKQD